VPGDVVRDVGHGRLLSDLGSVWALVHEAPSLGLQRLAEVRANESERLAFVALAMA